MSSTSTPKPSGIKAIDKTSVHRIASGQVIVDLQTAVKELVENSMDAGATTIEVRFKQYGLTSVEVVDNGSGIAEEDCESVGLKHYTSKLSTFDDLSIVRTFGFRGEAVSSLCAVCDSVVVTTTTEGPMGVQLELEQSGRVGKKTKVARQRGTTVLFTSLFAPLPVRRKELQRNAKREFSKALGLLNAYALGPCAGMDESGRAVRLIVTNQLEKGQKVPQIKTDGVPSFQASMTALWGPKAMDNTVELDLDLRVQRDKSTLKRLHDKYSQGSQPQNEDDSIPVPVKGLISKFAVGCGRTGTDRQFFYVNGRPCNLMKVQKAFNEVYKSFNANQSPFVLANFIVPTDHCDINVSPDKRTIFLQSEHNLIDALKNALENAFSSHQATFDISPTPRTQSALTQTTFNSPYSRRLSLKAGSGLSKSHPEAQKEAAKETETERPAADGDAERGSAAPAAPIPTAAEPEEPIIRPPRPVAKKVAQLLKPTTSGPSKAGQADGAISVEKGSLGKRSSNSRAEAEDFRPAQGVPTIEDLMAIDYRPKDASSKEASRSLVVDTTKTVWGQLTRKGKAVDKPVNDVPEPAEGEEPVAKKRKVSFERGTEGSIVPPVNFTTAKGKNLTPVQNLRSSLARFAVGASRAAAVSEEESTAADKTLVEGEEEEDDEIMDESAEQCRKDTRRGELAAIEGAYPKIRPITLGKKNEERKNDGSAQKPIELDELDADGDVGMEDDILPSPSPTLVPPERRVTKCVDLGNNDVAPSAMDDAIPDIDDGGVSTARSSDGATLDIDDVISSTPCTSDSAALDVNDAATSSAAGTPDVAVDQENTGKCPEIVRSGDRQLRDVRVRFDLEQVKKAWDGKKKVSTRNVGEASCVSRKVSADASLANTEDNESATRALERVIEKSDFANMDIIGQFNLGFIIVRRRKAVGDEQASDSAVLDDLFIVDQHAADEKYNFETLQQTTKIQSQTLFRPRPLELTAADELVAMENIEVITENGFELQVDETAVAGQGAKLQVTAIPVSKSTDFDLKDLEELIHLMRDQPSGKMVRCSKARSMFAMRACRKSVMIGMALNKNQMTTVVHHMGTIDQPWNCPHGRPTMRHLIDLCPVSLPRPPRTINWTALNDMG